MRLKRKIFLYMVVTCIFFSLFYFLLFHFILAIPLEEQKTNSAKKLENIEHNFEKIEKAAGFFSLLLIAGFFLFGIIFYITINRSVIHRINTISFNELLKRIPDSNEDEINLLTRNIKEMLERVKEENIKRVEVDRMFSLNEKLVFLSKVSTEIAHEINNPLFAVSNSFQLAKRYLPTDNKRVNDAVQVLEKEIRRMKKLCRGMYTLVIKDIEASTLSDIATIMTAAINILEWSNKLKDSDIDFKQQDSSFPLFCNPLSLQQVFMNVIINAVEATDGKGKVIIDISEDNQDYRIDFIDTGPGIPDDLKAEIFHPFRSTKPEKGEGLGLHISHHIVTNHGGTITLDNSGQQGAHFIIKIPKEKKGGRNNDEEPVNTISRR